MTIGIENVIQFPYIQVPSPKSSMLHFLIYFKYFSSFLLLLLSFSFLNSLLLINSFLIKRKRSFFSFFKIWFFSSIAIPQSCNESSSQPHQTERSHYSCIHAWASVSAQCCGSVDASHRRRQADGGVPTRPDTREDTHRRGGAVLHGRGMHCARMAEWWRWRWWSNQQRMHWLLDEKSQKQTDEQTNFYTFVRN